MANQEHLDILKQGVQAWNQWREKNSDINPNLIAAKLRSAHLSFADLDFADLSSADLSSSDLRYSNLIAADLSHADLSSSDLSHAQLGGADLSGANLSHAYLRHAQLVEANLKDADLNEADLSEANLKDADLSKAIVGWTRFGDVDLSAVKNLETVNHDGPSTIGIDTIYRSQGKIPEMFLREAGVPDAFIEYMRTLLNNPIDYYSCFISYSSKDQSFVERLYTDLQNKGVRCWFALEDMKIGDKIRPRIEETIRNYDKLLIVLSEHSIASIWVAYEVERALNKEPQGIPNVLFPIRVDDAVMKSKAGWADDIKSIRHIGDFTNWKNHDDYQKAFTRLLRDLKAEAEQAELGFG